MDHNANKMEPPEEAMSQEEFDEVLVLRKDEPASDDPAKTLVGLADELADTKREKASLEDQLKTVNKGIDDIELKMVDIMTALDMDNFKHDGKMFYQFVQSHPRVTDEEGFFALLEEYGEGGIIKRTVHPQTLKAWCKDKSLEWGERLAGKLEIFEKIRIGVRKT
jgi:sulfatase maturation enzyme AslB (radical SAM superfamily)